MNARTAIAWLKKSGKPAVKKGMARYAIEFLRTLELVERGASDERNFVKKAVSWALRGIGKRSRPRLTSCRVPTPRSLS
jgi:3-methyladenine DNA glycosylase AlkD